MPCFLALVRQLAQWVAMKGRGVDDVERIGLGVEHGEAVVVLGGDDDVLHAGGLGQRHHIMRIEAGGLNLRRQSLVVGDRDRAVVHDPFADARNLLAVPRAGGNGVEAPVDEHAEAGVAPPAHARVPLGRRLRVLDCSHRMVRIGGNVLVLGLRPGRECK